MVLCLCELLVIQKTMVTECLSTRTSQFIIALRIEEHVEYIFLSSINESCSVQFSNSSKLLKFITFIFALLSSNNIINKEVIHFNRKSLHPHHQA